MRHCIVCGGNKPDDKFASAISMTCNVCTRGMGGAVGTTTHNNTHSIGIKPHPHNNKIARSLLDVAGFKAHVGRIHNDQMENTAVHLGHVVPPVLDDRPLIDKLHEATFGEAEGIDWIKDKYALRMLLRKAHCFTLDTETSAMVADLSIAIANDLETSRKMAIPPFPVTWVEIDNEARINRIQSLAIRTTSKGSMVPRIGWLIHPGENGGFYATYVTWLDQGILVAPLSYWWHCGSRHPSMVERSEKADTRMAWMAFGMKETNVHPYDAFPDRTPLHAPLSDDDHYVEHVLAMMSEMAGELRHVWGFLIALGAGHLGVEMRTSEPRKHQGEVRMMKNGKPLLPMEHRVLHLHLGRRLTVDKMVARAITHHKNREHDVRGHWREYRNEDGSVRMRVPVKSHKRGDIRLGRIEKTYSVEK